MEYASTFVLSVFIVQVSKTIILKLPISSLPVLPTGQGYGSFLSGERSLELSQRVKPGTAIDVYWRQGVRYSFFSSQLIANRGSILEHSLPLELAIIVPTFKERENVVLLLERLAAVLVGVSYEVVFVDDDSPDGTAEVVREVGKTTPWVRVLQRIGRR